MGDGALPRQLYIQQARIEQELRSLHCFRQFTSLAIYLQSTPSMRNYIFDTSGDFFLIMHNSNFAQNA